MKAFIDRIFKKRKHDAEQIEENKGILSEQIETAIKNKVAQAALEDIIKEADKIIVEELKQAEVITKPGHYFNDCNCVKCVRWRSQNAK
jgi:transcriptional regulator of heat shock response